MKVAVVSSVYGGYDDPVPPKTQDVACDFVLVTDDPALVDGWNVIFEPRPALHPRYAAKIAKCRPDLFAEADVHIWIDASIRVFAYDFVSWCLDGLGDALMAQIPHADRDHIVDEAAVSMLMDKYNDLPVLNQAMHYIQGGYPDGWGLWQCGLRVQRNTPETRAFGDAWLREQFRWTYQDQISQPPLLWAAGIRPADLEGPMVNNPRFTLRAHASLK